MSASAQAMAAFNAMDTNHDGVLSRPEFHAMQQGGSFSMAQPAVMAQPQQPGFFSGITNYFQPAAAHAAPTYAAPAVTTYAAPPVVRSGSMSLAQPVATGGSVVMSEPGLVQQPQQGFFAGLASFFQRPTAAPAVQPAGSVSIARPSVTYGAPPAAGSVVAGGSISMAQPVHTAPPVYAAPAATYAQPVTHVAPPVYAAPQVTTAAPVTYAAPPVTAQPGTVSNLRPHPSIAPAEISSVAHPPQRMDTSDRAYHSYVGPSGGAAHLVAHPTNYQQTNMMPTTDFHPVNRFVPQDVLHAAGPEAHLEHQDAFGPRTVATHAFPAAAPVTYAAPVIHSQPAAYSQPAASIAAPSVVSGGSMSLAQPVARTSSMSIPQPAATAAPPVYAAPHVTTYAAPQVTTPVVHAAPPVYASPPTTAIAPPVYAAPPTTTTAPPVYAAPPTTTTAPPVYAAPPTTTMAPPVYAAPATTTTEPAYGSPHMTSPVTYAAPPVYAGAAHSPVTYTAAPTMLGGFDALDRNHDGVITRPEFAQAMQGGSGSVPMYG